MKRSVVLHLSAQLTQHQKVRIYTAPADNISTGWGQVQLTGGYISDPTFLEQWFNREFRTQQPLQTSLYAKHQSGSEAYSLLISGELNNFALKGLAAGQYHMRWPVQYVEKVSR